MKAPAYKIVYRRYFEDDRQEIYFYEYSLELAIELARRLAHAYTPKHEPELVAAKLFIEDIKNHKDVFKIKVSRTETGEPCIEEEEI
jgi:hypothetical protein